ARRPRKGYRYRYGASKSGAHATSSERANKGKAVDSSLRPLHVEGATAAPDKSKAQRADRQLCAA
ncbi:MAG: hypothetical protein JWN04_525, partial [Myxococcaceae bacterium]|nr:hypothetical protein [Myxococcaceae bacterium]